MQCHLILYSISAVFIPQSLQQVDLWLLLFWWLSILTQNLPLFIQSCLTVQGCSAISVFPDGLREKQGSVWSQHRKIPEARGCIAIGIVHAQYMLIPVVTMEMAWLLHRLLCCLHSCNRSFLVGAWALLLMPSLSFTNTTGPTDYCSVCAWIKLVKVPYYCCV